MFASDYRKVSPSNHPFDEDNLPLSEFPADHARRSSPTSSRPSSRTSIERNNAMESRSEGAAHELERFGGRTPPPPPPPPSSQGPLDAASPQMKVAFSFKKFQKLLLPGLASWLVTLLLIGGFFTTVSLFQERVMSPQKKSLFDTITTILSLALGLNVASSLRAVSLNLRWWILTIEKRPAREVDLILHCDSMTKLLELIYFAPQPKTLVASIFWLSLNILAQAGIAILSLTFSGEPGIGDIYRAPGDSVNGGITIPNMTEFAPHKGRFGEGGYLPELFGAHLLGDIGSSYNFSMLPDYPLAGTPWASNPAAFWNATDHWEYIFLDSAPLTRFSGPSFLSIHTDRVVKSSAICTTPPYAITLRDGLAVIKLVDTNQTAEFPKIALGLESIYYLTRPAISGHTTTTTNGIGSCGLGCSEVHVLEPAAGPPAPGSFVNKLQPGYFYYHCNITVEPDAGNQQQQQQLRPQTAAIAAQAIALSGRIHSELQNSTLSGNQYFTYNFGLPFGEPQNNSAAGMAQLLSRFAIGVIAATAQTNPPITIPGLTPKQGIRLQLNAPVAFYLILALIGGIQLVLIIFTAIVVSPIKIPDEIPWSHQERIQSRFVRK